MGDRVRENEDNRGLKEETGCLVWLHSSVLSSHWEGDKMICPDSWGRDAGRNCE